jgi:hypothetical protein
MLTLDFDMTDSMLIVWLNRCIRGKARHDICKVIDASCHTDFVVIVTLCVRCGFYADGMVVKMGDDNEEFGKLRSG